MDPNSNQVPLVKPTPASNTLTVVLVVLALILVGTTAFFGYQNYQLKKQSGGVSPITYASPSPTGEESNLSAYPTLSASMSPAPSASPTSNPTITSPLANSLVTSPLTVTGVAPVGWMFEGQLVIKLLDSKRMLIVQGAGKEKIPGSWQNGKPTDFSGNLVFTTSDTTGFLVIEADNPSGLPENSKSYEIAVRYK